MSNVWVIGFGALVLAVVAGYAVKKRDDAIAYTLGIVSLLLGLMAVAKYLGGILRP